MVTHPGSARAARSARRLNAPRPALVEAHADGIAAPRQPAGVAIVREEWRVVDRWWTDEPVHRRYFDLVLETGENTVVYRDDENVLRGSPSEREPPRRTSSCTHIRAYSFLDGASLPEELAARAAELGYDALALTDHDGVYGSLEFAHAAKHFGVRAITGAEVTLAGDAHVTLLCETQQRLREPLPHPHRRARGHARRRPRARAAAGRDDASTCSQSTPRGSSRSRAARGTGSASSTRTAPARLARAFAGRVLRRAAAAVRARRRAAQRAARGARRRTLRVPTVATGDVHAHHIRARTAAGRARRDPQPHLARRLRARAARQPRDRCCSRRPRCSSGCRATRRCARARSPTAARST